MYFMLQCFYFLLPTGLANLMPSLMKPFFKGLGRPIDGNRKFLGKPIFGHHKTWRGLFWSPLMGLLVFSLQKYLYQFDYFKELSIIDYDQHRVYLGLVFGLGVVLGELTNSFIKRRIAFKPGRSFIPFDQIDYTIGSLFLISFWIWPGFRVAGCVVALGFFLHIIFNLIGYSIKLKKNKL